MFLAGYILGLISGFGAFIIYGTYQLSKITKLKRNLINSVKESTRALENDKVLVKDRLTKAQELAKIQAELKAQAEMPSKNSVHSKYKNGLVSEIFELEKQKLEILRSIIEDGIDPVITMVDDEGSKKEITLSSYIETAQGILDSKDSSVLPGASDQPKKINKFTVLKGGKDDGGTTH